MNRSYIFVLGFSVVFYFNEVKVAAWVNYGVYPENSKENHDFYRRIEPEMRELADAAEVTRPHRPTPPDINPETLTDLDLAKTNEYFEIFKKYYNRHYVQVSVAEESKRRKIFEDNLKRVMQLRDFIPSANFIINEYFDFTLEEFHSHFTGFSEQGLDYNSTSIHDFKKRESPPDQLDWTAANFNYLPRHQGNCKGSYLFAALANVEIQELRIYGKTNGYYSVLAPYDCEPYGSCAKGGLPHLVLETMMYLGGVSEDETAGNPSMPYAMRKKGPCQYWNTRKKFINITNVLRFRVNSDEDLKAAIYELGPVTTAIYVSEALKNYRSGILTGVNCNERPNHAVLLVGYGYHHGTPYWIIRNSWGPEWGENGHFFLSRENQQCGIGRYLVTVEVERIKYKQFEKI